MLSAGHISCLLNAFGDSGPDPSVTLRAIELRAWRARNEEYDS